MQNNNQGRNSMKSMKVIGGLGLIALGVFVGSFIHLGNGTGVVIGFISGLFLCCVILLFRKHRPGSTRLNDQYQVTNNVDKLAIDNTIRSVQVASIEEQMRHQDDLPRW